MCIHSLKRILVVTLGLALLITAVPPLLAQHLEAQEVDAVLGPERDPDNTNKVPPMWEAIRTADGKVRVIVQLSDPAVALYKDGMAARPAISPKATGRTKLDMAAKQTKQYRRFLATRQKQARQRVQQVAPSARTFRRYSVVFNGMSMAVNENEIAAIAALPEVARVYPDKMYYATMDASLPLIQAPEFWAELGGRDAAGEGIKVAVVDGGIRPEHPMFDGTGFDFPPGYPLADDYCGAVDPSFCNGKLIVARHFRTVSLHPDEFDSPLGANGHGTHVSGSAVGNFVAGATAPDGVPEDLSGVAPGAWLMAYKALWWNGTTGSGSTTDLIAALEAAVADGADVINNSWGGPGGEDPNTDAFNAVFEAIRAAGVVSVTAAGNAGPGARSVGCPGCQPPTLTVANSTTNRLHALGFDITETDGPTGNACLEGTGPTLGASVGPQPVVYSGDVGDFEGCSAFPTGSMTGAIALISRGSCNFSTKVQNATDAGADFTVVFNNVGGAPITMGGLEGASDLVLHDLERSGDRRTRLRAGQSGGQRTGQLPGLAADQRRLPGQHCLGQLAWPQRRRGLSQARCRGTRNPNHVRLVGRPSDRWQRIHHYQRHQHGESARRGRGCPDAAKAPRLDSGSGEIGDHEHCCPRPGQGGRGDTGGSVRPRCWSHRS